MAWIVGIGLTLILFFSYPKQMALLAVLAAILIAWIFWGDYQNRNEKSQLNSMINIKIVFDDQSCSSEFPLLITVLNNSGAHLTKVHFGINGYRNGFSDPLYNSYYSEYESDKILAPGERWAGCYRIPKAEYGVSQVTLQNNPASGLRWVIKSQRGDFQRRR